MNRGCCAAASSDHGRTAGVIDRASFTPMLRVKKSLNHLTHQLTLFRQPRILNHMVEQEPTWLDAVFHALADDTRRRMLGTLAGGERSVGRLAAPFAMSLAAASKHIGVLERAGLVERAVAGRTHRLRLAPAPLVAAYQWLVLYERFWSGRLDILERLLREEVGAPTAPTQIPNPPPAPTDVAGPANLPTPDGDEP
jgi:DNA-binding transcriptional ArsR family regulator